MLKIESHVNAIIFHKHFLFMAKYGHQFAIKMF